MMMYAGQPEDIRRLIIQIARALVDDSDAVSLEAVKSVNVSVLKLRVAPAEVGRVIGKQGRTAAALRTILNAVSVKLHHNYSLEIIEDHTRRSEDADSAASAP